MRQEERIGARAARRAPQVRWWPGAVALALASAYPGALGLEQLAHGGLAPLAVTALVAAFVAIPLAGIEWRARLDPGGAPWARGAYALATMWSVLLAGAVAAPLVGGMGFRGGALAIALWVALALLVQRLGTIVAVGATLVVSIAATATAGQALGEAVPWTLLDPRWDTWRGWLPEAVGGSFLLSAAGFGQWGTSPAPPGARRAPWLTAGGALLAAVLVALALAATFEAGGVMLPIVRVTSAVAVAAAVLSRPVGPPPLWLAVAGALATLWFAFPASGTLPLFWSVLPLGPAVVAAVLAAASEGTTRWFAAAASGVAVASVLVAWPGLPSSGTGAAAAAALLVAVVWVVGTAVITRRPLEGT